MEDDPDTGQAGAHRQGVVVDQIVGMTFIDERLDLSHKAVIGCTFDGCIIEIKKAEPYGVLAICSFNDCLLVGEGWPTEMRQLNWRRSL